MKRFALCLVLIGGLCACSHNNDPQIKADEAQAVYFATSLVNNGNSNTQSYVGPTINTMDANNTDQTFGLQAQKTAQGTKNYQLMVLLIYPNNWRLYDSASLVNQDKVTFNVVSREDGGCINGRCLMREMMAISLTEDFLIQHAKTGFQVNIHAQRGGESVLFVPSPYIIGFMDAADKKTQQGN